MRAEIISIGDELTSGQRLDTNSQWLSQQLGEMGVRVMFHTTVADDVDANVVAFQQAFGRVDLVLCTGGLGPTADDLTRQAVAEAVGLPLVQDRQALEHIKELFRRRQRPMPEQNTIQSMFPEGSQVVHNPHGSAPGIDLAIKSEDGKQARLFALPGVPAEMKEMWEQTVRGAILEMVPGMPSVISHHQIKCFGVGESDLEQMLPDLVRRGRQPTVGITVSKATITLRLTARGETEAACMESMQPTITTIHECLGPLVFGTGEDELQDAVTRLLVSRGMKLHVVEIGTRGLINQWMSQVESGAEGYRGGVVCVDLQEVFRMPGMPAGEPSLMTGDPAESIRACAGAVRELLEVDCVLITGAIRTSSEHPDDPGIDLVLATKEKVEYQWAAYRGHPDIRRSRAAKQALDFVRHELRGAGEES
ncbi:MAG: CinA family nicotinamide mononucleotide deamidase-related protein [Planctomycetota bacterium]|nr:CinA family nicotinamide mononucleotide deamidase-related protein [Planctomycetota bacterium]